MWHYTPKGNPQKYTYPTDVDVICRISMVLQVKYKNEKYPKEPEEDTRVVKERNLDILSST